MPEREMRKRNARQLGRGLLALASLAMVTAALLALARYWEYSNVSDSAGQRTVLEQKVQYDGRWYVPKQNLETILVMGLDKYDRREQTVSYTNSMQADFLLLLVADRQEKSVEVLQLNRDTMTEIRRLGVGGAAADSYTAQLALAHTYGSGGSDSCLNAVKAVSTLLHGAPIDHYLTLTMDAVSVINDAVGGVELTLQEDLTVLNPRWEKGTRVILSGEDALEFVRARMQVGDGLNTSRMKRQEQYLRVFSEKLLEKNRQQQDFLQNTLRLVNDSFQSDMTVNQLEIVGKLLSECELKPFRSLKGETVEGEEFYEFYADEETLQEMVLALFYEEA